MKEILVYEMLYHGENVESDLDLTPLHEKYYEEYLKLQNECFFEMRNDLDIKPYNCYSSIDQLAKKINNIYLLVQNNFLVGSVSCFGNEIDDLCVNIKFQNQGYGKQLLIWALNFIQSQNTLQIVLHVAKWNSKAIKLYKKNNFKCIKIEKIR